MVLPLTVMRPDVISFSASRREQMPALAMALAMRISPGGRLVAVAVSSFFIFLLMDDVVSQFWAECNQKLGLETDHQ